MATRDMIVFGEDWGAFPTSTQHLIRHLSQTWRILWVNSIGLRRPRLDARDLKRIATKLGAAVRQKSGPSVQRAAIPDGVSVLSPVAVPLPGMGPAMRVNRLLLARQLKARITELGMERPLLWTSLPTALAVVGALDERATVYYCCDDFGALSGVDHEPVLAMERALAEKAHLFFVSNERLAERFPTQRTIYLPHGVDAALFSTPAPRADDLPMDGPVAGFYGSFQDWLDKDLLRAAALALPDWRFVFIGPVVSDASKLEDLPNVEFLGPRPHSALPSYAQHWTVSLIPFLPTPQILASNPLKLREYLAAGSPIVATPFPALEPYRAHVRVAEDSAGFIEAIRAAGAGADDIEARRARSAAVAAETWESRAETVRIALEEFA